MKNGTTQGLRPILNCVKFLSYLKQIFAGLGGKNALNIVFGQIFVTSAHSVMKLDGLDDLGFAKSAMFREEQQKEKLPAIQDPIEGLGIDILF